MHILSYIRIDIQNGFKNISSNTINYLNTYLTISSLISLNTN